VRGWKSERTFLFSEFFKKIDEDIDEQNVEDDEEEFFWIFNKI
jgi:hypothetical protein